MTSQPSAPPGPPTGGADVLERPRRRYSLLTRRDKIVMGLMVGIPTFLCLALIWFPTVFSVGLSFTNWQGYTGLEAKNFIGLKNYETLFTAYQPFWPAVWHNILWLLVFVFIATPIGIFLAVLLDREMRGTRLYQSAFFIPVVLSLAVVGIIWQLQYTLAGLHQQRPRPDGPGQCHRLAGQPGSQHLGRAGRGQLAARRLRDGAVPGRTQERGPDAP